jgi:hypothetical protein
VARTLRLTRTVATGSKDSNSITDDEEKERVSAKEKRAKKKEDWVKKKGKKEKGIKRADSQVSGKGLEKKIKRSKRMEEVEERGTEEVQGPVLDLEMTEALDSLDKEPEREEDQLKKERESDRLMQPEHGSGAAPGT